MCKFVGKLLAICKLLVFIQNYPCVPGDSKDLISRIIMQVFPGCIILFIFVESYQGTLYQKVNTRRLRLTPIPKVEMTKTFLFPPTVRYADLIY